MQEGNDLLPDDLKVDENAAKEEPVEVQFELFQNDIDFLNLINQGLTASEFNDLVMKLKSASLEGSQSWKAVSIKKTETGYQLESNDGKFNITLSMTGGQAKVEKINE